MERMTKEEGMTPEEYIAKLEEEVESRKEYQHRSQSVDGEHIENLLGEKYKLEEENKKLNIKVASLEGEIKGLNSVIDKLKEENQYREDIADVLPEGKGHIAEETIQDLQKEIKRLNEELDKAHTAYRAVRKINQELMNGYV